MTDVAPDTGTDATTEPAEPAAPTAPDTGSDLEAEVEKWKSQARKHEDRAKANAAAAKELEQFRKASMTEQERAVAEAKVVGRQEALVEVGGRLAAAEVRVAAAGRLDSDQLATLLDGIDLARFLTDDGEVDTAKVATFVDGIAPKPTDGTGIPLDLGQGARGPGVALNSDPLLESIKAAVGAR